MCLETQVQCACIKAGVESRTSHYKGLHDLQRPHFLEGSKGLIIGCMNEIVQKSVLCNICAPDKL